MGDGSVAFGIFLAATGGGTLALGMVIQRYALMQNGPIIFSKKKNIKFPRNFVWFLGLLLYGIANGFYAVSFFSFFFFFFFKTLNPQYSYRE